MEEKYSFTRKIASILKKEHGITATATETGEAGLRVVAGSYSETISGVITKQKLAALAARIKGAA